jgi:hypothetical protein
MSSMLASLPSSSNQTGRDSAIPILLGRDLNPNSPSAVAGMGILYNYLGRPDEAIVYLDEAKLLDRFFDPAWYWHARGVAHFVARRYDEAIGPAR